MKKIKWMFFLTCICFFAVSMSECNAQNRIKTFYSIPLGDGWSFTHSLDGHDLYSPCFNCIKQKNGKHLGWAISKGRGNKNPSKGPVTYWEMINVHLGWWFEPYQFCFGLYESTSKKCWKKCKGISEKNLSEIEQMANEIEDELMNVLQSSLPDFLHDSFVWGGASALTACSFLKWVLNKSNPAFTAGFLMEPIHDSETHQCMLGCGTNWDCFNSCLANFSPQ